LPKDKAPKCARLSKASKRKSPKVAKVKPPEDVQIIGSVFWVRGSDLEPWMGEVISISAFNGRPLVWWWGRDEPNNKDSVWNRQVDLENRTPLTKSVHPACLLSRVTFKDDAGQKANLAVAVYPPMLGDSESDSSSSSDSDDKPLCPAAAPVSFSPVNFFYRSLMCEFGKKKNWSTLWDDALVLDCKFLVWLQNAKLNDRKPTEANAHAFLLVIP
jgi:hypothetical protein